MAATHKSLVHVSQAISLHANKRGHMCSCQPGHHWRTWAMHLIMLWYACNTQKWVYRRDFTLALLDLYVLLV
jgi:hypothetical protein